MKLFKRDNSQYWQFQFIVKGKRYRGSTYLTNKAKAITHAGHIREEVLAGNIGILERKPKPTFAEFLDESFLPFIRTKHKAKPKTLNYYEFGAGQLKDFKPLADAQIDEITSEHSSKYAAYHPEMSASGINQGLRTLRRALRLAFEWNKLDRVPSIHLASGERKRRRVVTQEEEAKYLAACPQPWRTMATVMIEVGLRPSEILHLRCEGLLWDEFEIDITDGKTDAARRKLPMTDRAYDALLSWWDAIGRPAAGFVFPAIGTGSMRLGRAGARTAEKCVVCGGKHKARGLCASCHTRYYRAGKPFPLRCPKPEGTERTDEDVFKASDAAAGWKSRPYSPQRIAEWHHQALEKAGLEQTEEDDRKGIEPIVPYTLRHSALTRLAKNCANPYAVAAAAGHTSIVTTMRYVHPQKAEIWAAFEKKSGHIIGHSARLKNLKVVGKDGDESE